MSYPFVQAKWFTPGGVKEIRAFVIHFAEGGGTVSWLTHPSGDNSADYVIGYDGSITQMVKDSDYSHSLHWDTAHDSAPDCGVFSFASAAALLGIPIGTFPLPYIKAVEIEGFAAVGPNPAQWAALENDLIPHVRATWPSCRGLLGHRDFMGYKACPGCHVFDRLHHGAWLEEIPVRSFTFDATAKAGTVAVKGTGHSYLRLRDDALISIPDPVAFGTRPGFGPVKLIGGGITGPADTRIDGYVVNFEAAFLITADVVFTPAVLPVGDCSAAVKAATEPLIAKIAAAKVALGA